MSNLYENILDLSETTDLEAFVFWINSLHPCLKRIFWCIHKLYFKFEGALYASQTKIAEWCKCCRQYVNKAIKFFVESGVLIKIYRHNTTCSYDIPDWLKLKNLRQVIKAFSLEPGDTQATQYIAISKSHLEQNIDIQTVGSANQEKEIEPVKKMSLDEFFESEAYHQFDKKLKSSKKPLEIPEHLKPYAMIDQVKALELLGYSQTFLGLVFERTQAYASEIKDFWAYVNGCCKKLHKQHQIPIDKKAYWLKYALMDLWDLRPNTRKHK